LSNLTENSLENIFHWLSITIHKVQVRKKYIVLKNYNRQRL